MENETKQVTIEEQNKIFLTGLRGIIEDTKGIRILGEKSVGSTVPNMFFITTENKDYNSWIKNAGITEDTELMYRKKFNDTESEDFPLVDIAKRLYNDFGLADDNEEEMKLIFPNLESYRLGTIYGYADVGRQVEIKNAPNKYYMGKNRNKSFFNIQIVPHQGHLEWLKSEKGISGYFQIETKSESEIFVELTGKKEFKPTQLKEIMKELGYKYHDITGIYFDGAYGTENVILH